MNIEKLPNPNIDIKKEKVETINNLEKIMSEWEKKPNSWIKPSDYNLNVNKEENLESKKKNKFRSQYFTIIILDCQKLARLIYFEDKIFGKKMIDKLELLRQKINKLKENKAPITENLIDEMDNFAKELIEKVKYEK